MSFWHNETLVSEMEDIASASWQAARWKLLSSYVMSIWHPRHFLTHLRARAQTCKSWLSRFSLFFPFFFFLWEGIFKEDHRETFQYLSSRCHVSYPLKRELSLSLCGFCLRCRDLCRRGVKALILCFVQTRRSLSLVWWCSDSNLH